MNVIMCMETTCTYYKHDTFQTEHVISAALYTYWAVGSDGDGSDVYFKDVDFESRMVCLVLWLRCLLSSKVFPGRWQDNTWH